jgi:hypothetical protein
MKKNMMFENECMGQCSQKQNPMNHADRVDGWATDLKDNNYMLESEK